MFLFPKFSRLRVPPQHADGTVKLQRVRISKGQGLPRTATILAIPLTFLLLETSEYWLPDQYKLAIQKARTKKAEEKKDISDQHATNKLQNSEESVKGRAARLEGEKKAKTVRPETVAWWIPCPNPWPWSFISQRDPVLYRETDKEWLEATRLLDDPARIQKVKKIIVSETLKVWAADKHTSNAFLRVGHKGVKGRIDIFLDVVVPLHRPSMYEIRGIAFHPDGARFAGRPVSNAIATRIERTLHPTVFFEAFWNAGVVFITASYRSLRDSINSSTLGSNSGVIFSSATSSQMSIEKSPHSFQPDFNSGAVDKEEDQIMSSFRQLTKTVTPEQPLAQAKHAFLQTFSALQIQALQQVPEGAVVFQGYVTFVGLRGKLRSTISAIYLPAQDRLICPIIVERTEILPDPLYWYHGEHSREQHGSKAGSWSKVTDSEQTSQKTKQYAKNIDQHAKALKNEQKSLDNSIAWRTAIIEGKRKRLQEAIEKLEGKMSGTSPPGAKDIAAAKIEYLKKQTTIEPSKAEPEQVKVVSEVQNDVRKSDEEEKPASGSLTIPKPEEHKKKEE